MQPDVPHILLVNPWIHDFAAYDFWAKPMGLLMIAGLLRSHGLAVSYIDCLNRFHTKAPPTDPSARCGRGPYLKTRLTKPPVLADVRRYFSRYGIHPQWFQQDVQSQKRPDLVLVTSLMTYWYPGVRETIEIIKSIYPHTPVVLGGIYARLCREHANITCGADHVAAAPGEKNLFTLVHEYTGFAARLKFDPADMDTYPYPALDLQTKINYIPLLTSRGCPFRCSYCASHLLEPARMRRSAATVVAEIQYWQKNYAVNDVVIYDDAFLADAEQHALPILDAVLHGNLKVRFHTPNAVHIRGITDETAHLMQRTGFTTLRLGLETAVGDNRQEMDRKVSAAEFKRAVGCLKKAGFDRRQVGAYLLAGLPGQNWCEIEQSVQTVKQSGITPIIAYFSPIPRTTLWPQAVASSRYDLEADPIFANNAVLPCQKEPFAWEKITRLKELTKT